MVETVVGFAELLPGRVRLDRFWATHHPCNEGKKDIREMIRNHKHAAFTYLQDPQRRRRQGRPLRKKGRRKNRKSPLEGPNILWRTQMPVNVTMYEPRTWKTDNDAWSDMGANGCRKPGGALKLLLTRVVGLEPDTDRVIFRPTTSNYVSTRRVDIVGSRSR